MHDRSSADVPPPSTAGDERTTLVACLDYLRDRIVAKLDGVDEVSARRSSLPSGTTIYWLGTHMSAVELNQFQRVLDGWADADLIPPRPPPSAEDRMADVLSRYRVACAESRRVLATFDDLDTAGRGVDRRRGEQRTARWVLVRVIEETARHAGHLDILREWLDGSTGR